jgi:large subunit ribosomal protein L15
MKLNQIADKPGARKKRMRIGRGIGSGMGKTGGRGGKGQTARAGVSIKGFEGGQMPLHRRVPKRGFTNIFRVEFAVVNLDRIAELFDAGTVVTPELLRERGLVPGGASPVKVLARGDVSKALTVKAHKFSGKAVEKIAAAGGTTEVLSA